jgi:phosphomannomutase
MNRLVVRQAAAGLGAYLLAHDPRAAERGVVIGHDARRKSDVFALDTARVLAAQGLRALLLPGPLPTPVVAWALTELDAAGAVVVTASHNPPRDNGYKVYLGDGAQIVPPHDTGIAAEIGRFDPTAIELAAEDDALIERLDRDIVERYVAAAPAVRLRPGTSAAGVAVAYTPMHGVGGAVLLGAFEAAGFPAPAVVKAQFDPDPTFPTVSFPNPEEPGAMDLVLELAAAEGAAVAIANDPDADRLGAAIPQPDGSWRRLGGDELGWLLADHILTSTQGADRLVVTTLVSSSLLGRMAEDHGVHFAETFTGFKWIGRMILDHPEWRFVFGYEQALGYLVAPRPLDKDGITAAVLLAEVAAVAAEDGTTLQARLDDIAARYGRHVVADRSIRMDPNVAAARVRALLERPPSELGGTPVVDVTAFPEADLLRLQLEGGVRVQVRPSGTEPKVKLYGEAIDADPTPYLTALTPLLTSD